MMKEKDPNIIKSIVNRHQELTCNELNTDNNVEIVKGINLNVLNTENNIEKGKEKGNGDEEESEAKQNLNFELKKISPFKLYYHLSEKIDIFLMIVAAIATIGAGTSNSLISILFGDAVNDFVDSIDIESLSKEEYEKLMDDVEHSINSICKKYLIFGACLFVAYFLMMFLWSYTALRQLHRLKENYFWVILRQEQGWFDENNPYEFSTKVQAQLEQIEPGIGDRFGQIILFLSQIISGFIIAFITSWKVSLVLLSVLPFIVGALIAMAALTEGIMVKSRKTYEKAGGVAEELLYNIKTVTSFTNFEYELKRFDNLVNEVYKLDNKKNNYEASFLGLISMLCFIAFFLDLFYSRLEVVKYLEGKSDFKAGDALTVLFTLLPAIFSLGSISPNIQIIKEACIASSDYFTLLEREPKIFVSNLDLKPEKNTINGKIEFRNIKFSYPTDKNNNLILDNLNIVINPGQKIAIVGESGCGKSTTVNLIERLYDPIEGEILLDDVNIKDYNLEYLRSLIGYVQQEPVLFNNSIKDNLIFGRQEQINSIGKEQELLDEACEEAYIKEFIDKNPDKYNYIVGIKGSKLSGGQKQRIAIARAILTKPKILILDEATSALDNKAEKEVQKALDNISKKKVTTIIIAHRLSTIQNADIIFALKDGRVAEKGTHKELLAMDGYYAGLVKSQISEGKIKDMGMKKMSFKSISNESRHLSENNLSVFEEQEKIKNKVKVEKKKIYDLIKDKKFYLIMGIAGAFLYGALSPIGGLVLGKATNAISLRDKDDVKKKGLKWSLLFIPVAILSGVGFYFKVWGIDGMGNIITLRMRNNILKKYLELHVGYYDFDTNTPGSLLSKLSIDTTQISQLLLSVIGSVVGTAGAIIVGLILGFIYDWKLTLILSAFIPFLVIAQVMEFDYYENGKESNKKIRIASGSLLSECLINTKTIFSFNFQKSAIKMYKDILEPETKEYLKDSIMKGFFLGLGTFISYVSYCVVFKCSIKFIRKKTLTYDNFNCVVNTLLSSVMGITDSLHGIGYYKKAKISFQSIYSTLNTKSEINAFLEENKDKISPENIKGKIEFKNVSFAYPTKPTIKVLKSINLTFEPGKFYGLVGYSGCGKSTIIQLTERYYDVQEGEILIDGVNIKDYNLYELRKKIGLVSQEPVLFKRNIYENILYGNLEASEEDVLFAAQKASISKFINKNDMGTKEDPLSGGEKQRVAIARAFLKNPVILLLDEATSALDKETEVEVQKSIDELQKGRTCISVAHRLSTIENSDEIFVLESGRLIEKGNHQQLIKLNGAYANLYKNSQK